MRTRFGKTVAFLTVSSVLSACGGGGGGGGTVSTATPIKTFTTWRTDMAGSEVQLKGQGMQAAYVFAAAATDIYNLQDASASALFSFDANGGLSGLVLASATPTSTTTVAFTGSEISVLALDTDFVKANSASRNAIISNPKSLAWDYQSFGVWEKTGTDTNSKDYGVISLGAPTAASAIPGSGTADFTGKVVGSYVNTAGVGHTVLADLNVVAHWGSQSLSFTTTGTETSPNLNTIAFAANPDLNLTGTAIYAAGTNSFSGTLTTASGLTGDTTGQFYGPAAQEMGGVFFLQGTDAIPETFAGAYGAKR